MIYFENVLVGLSVSQILVMPCDDLSVQNRQGVEVAIDLAMASGAQLTFCAVIPQHVETGPPRAMMAAERGDDVDATVRRNLISLQEMAESKGIPARGLIRSGDFGDELIAELCEEPYDLLIVDRSPGHTSELGPSDLTIWQLICNARSSVWAVNTSRRNEIQNIGLLKTDNDDRVVSLAVSLARQLNARLHVLQPIDATQIVQVQASCLDSALPEDVMSALRHAAETELRDRLARTDFRTLPFGMKVQILDDDAVATIDQYAAEHMLDLFVVHCSHLIPETDTERFRPNEWRAIARNHSILALKFDH